MGKNLEVVLLAGHELDGMVRDTSLRGAAQVGFAEAMHRGSPNFISNTIQNVGMI